MAAESVSKSRSLPRSLTQYRSIGPSSSMPMPQTVPTKPYDWTYTTTYAGHNAASSSSSIAWKPADPENREQTIPIAELTRRDPILFYSEIPLFEDELHDNGSSHLLVRIVSESTSKLITASRLTVLQRVMPTCLFILARFTLRVDNVLFRAFDTRIYHAFNSDPPLVIRETSGWEAPYDRVKRVRDIISQCKRVTHRCVLVAP